MNNLAEIYVKSNKIGDRVFTFLCPFCVKIRGGRVISAEEGTKYKSASPNFHIHGSCGDLSNRTESRASHCDFFKGNFNIIIDDETERI